jgi:predicted PurR-regulated permease PerM
MSEGANSRGQSSPPGGRLSATGDKGRARTPADQVPLRRIEISSRTILAVVLTVAGLWLLNTLLPILVVLVMALILVGTLDPFVGWLRRHGINRTVAIGVVFIACLLVVGLIGLLTVPALWAQVTQTISDLPHLQETMAGKLESHHLTAPLADAIRTFKPEKALRGLNMTSAVVASLSVFEAIG